MPVFYCQNCGAKHTYSGKKPESCSKCRTKFEVVATSLSFPKSAPSTSLKRESSSVDPRLQRRIALLEERRGQSRTMLSETGGEEVDEDVEDEGEDFDIPRPKRLGVQLEVSNGSVGSIGEVLKSENPTAFKDL